MATDAWNGSTADWYTSAYWSNGIPTRSSAVVINSGQAQLLTGDAGIIVYSMSIGGGNLSIGDPSQTQRVLGDVSIASGGGVSVDTTGLSAGGSSLMIGRNLSNSGSFAIGGYTSAPTTVIVGGSLSNASSATLSLSASSGGAQTTLDVSATAGFGRAGVLTGSVFLSGNSLLEFNRGQITNIAGELWLADDSRIADAGSTTSSSALTGLSTVSGVFGLSNGASVRTSGNLSLASGGVVHNYGGSLTIGGNLFNSGILENLGAVTVNGRDGISNAGSIIVAMGASLTSKALRGGSVEMEGGSALEFGGSSNTQITFGVDYYGGAINTLKLDDSRQFTGTLSGLSNVDTIDLADLRYVAGKTTASYSGTASSGTLTVRNGFTSVKLALVGDYTSSTWTLSSDGHGGTNLVDPASSPSGSSLVAQASSNAVSVPAASQNSQTAHALLTQYAASSFAPAASAAAVVSAPQVAATPLLAGPHHA